MRYDSKSLGNIMQFSPKRKVLMRAAICERSFL